MASSSRQLESRTGTRLLHVAALAALAVATPLCEVLSRSPQFLWVHQLDRPAALGLAAALLALAPLPLMALVLLARWAEAGGRRTIAAVALGLAVAVPLACVALQVGVRLGVGGWLALVVAAAVGLGGALAYRRWGGVRGFVTLLGLVALVGPWRLVAAADASAPEKAGEWELGRTGSQAQVVVVVFDELPMLSLLAEDGALDGENFPNFSRLAATSHMFLDARADLPATLRALPPIVTGGRVRQELAPTAANYPRTLFTILGGDHDIWAFETVTRLCPEELNRRQTKSPTESPLVSDLRILWLTLTVPRPWADELPPVDMAWGGFAGESMSSLSNPPADEPEVDDYKTEYKRARERLKATRAERHQQFREFVRQVGTSDGPSLLFMHSMLPHAPFIFMPDGQLYDDGGRARPGGLGEAWVEDRDIVALAYQRHLLQVQFVDRLLGELLDRLDATGTFDRTAIVVTADHGGAFRPGVPLRDSSRRNPDETLWVPLMIKGPGQNEGRVHRQRVATGSILPTLLDLLGVESPWPVDARSAFDATDSAPTELTTARQVLAWKSTLFGSPPDLMPPLRLNRHADLIGVPLADLEVRRSRDFELRRVEPAGTLDYAPEATLLPTWVTGRLVDRRTEQEGGGGCCDLAFSVEGTVAAVLKTYPGGKVAERFQVLLPIGALQPGSNTLEIFVVEGEGANRRLLRPRQLRRR